MKKALPTLLIIFVFLAGIAVFLYPTVSNYLYAKNSSKAIDIRRISNNNGDGNQTIPKFIYALYISSRNTISFALIRMLFIWRTHSI